ADRLDVAVADGRERLDAEKERAREAAADLVRRDASERAGSAKQIRHGEEGIRRDVRERDDAEEARPRDGQEPVIQTERPKERQPHAARIEGAVAIEQSLLVDAAND